MHTSRTARKLVAGATAAVVSLLLVGGTVASVSTDDAVLGVKSTTSAQGRGV